MGEARPAEMAEQNIAVEEGRAERATPPEKLYPEKHLNQEAVEAIQTDKKPWELDGFAEKKDKPLMWKVDSRLVPCLGPFTASQATRA
jgi:hypothetical protein